MPMPSYTPLPDAPSPSDAPATFNTKAFALAAALPTFGDEMNALGAAIDEVAQTFDATATAAQDALLAAALASGAGRWVMGATYNPGDVVWSPLNNQSYRARVAMGTLLHPYWRLNIADVWNGGDSVALQYIDMRGVSGGADLTSGGTPFASVSPFDGALASLFGSNTGSFVRFLGTMLQVGYHFAAPVSVAEYVIAVHPTLSYNTCAPRDWTLEWSDDGISWVAVQYVTNQTNWTAGQARTFTSIAPGATDPSLDPTNWAQISGTPNADTVDGLHASLTPVAGQIGAFNAQGQLVIPTGGGVKMSNVANADATTSDWCEKNSYWLATGTGCSGTAPTGNVTFTRRDNIVSMTIPGIIGTSNTNAFTLSAGPTSMRPTAQRVCSCFVQDGGVNYMGRVVINTDGTLVFFRDYLTPFATSGSKGVQVSSITYLI